MAISTLSKFTVPLANDQSSASQGLLMPKLQYRFRAILENFGVSTPRSELTKLVMDVMRPNLSFDKICSCRIVEFFMENDMFTNAYGNFNTNSIPMFSVS